MRFLGRSLTGLFLLAVTLAVLALAVQTMMQAMEESRAESGRRGTARERAFAVNVVTVEPGAVRPMLETFGEVHATRSLELRAQVGGPVVALGPDFEEGGRVVAGDLLLQVDPSDLQDALALAGTDLAEAEAEVADAAAALEIARDDLASAEAQSELRAQALTRQRDLARRGVGTEAAVETSALAAAAAEQAILSRRTALANAEARANQAENTLARRRIALDEAARRLAETKLTAGFAGTLTGVTAAEGRIVTANEKVATLIDPEALEVQFRLSLAQYGRLLDAAGNLTGAEVTVHLAVSGVELVAKGRIDRESAEVGENQTGRLIFAQLDAASGLRPGDFVTVEIREPEIERAVRLPSSALDAASTVLVLGEADRLEVADVELLRRQGDDVLVRAPGLSGREVVAERSPALGAGILVRPIRRDADGDAVAEAPAEPEMIDLTPERRAALVELVENNPMMPADAKERILGKLREDGPVSAKMVERIEGGMSGGGGGGMGRGG